ncbi:hypothetical protein EPD60_14080 [Flaviaesturariibacter flavus]|uniref:Signal peptidase I n=1 Tax=Flaviaesturariibacter flavus TaxID=2502780 RepID=A0A4R1B8G3_9BACT|nr:DUF5684 domain-containing protein [Flaviaesturariibacter flavus]TCJ12403.1 hypothetical protein EPD60_14080 [Flaviaesturariibacter flavus]
MLLFVLFILSIVVFMFAAFWRVFQKADQPGWAAIIPFYNLYIMLKIAGKPGWWLVLLLIPLVNYVFLIWMYNMIAKSFGKDEGFTVGMVLLGFVFWPILGFGDARYLGPYGDPAAWERYRNREGFDFEQHRIED